MIENVLENCKQLRLKAIFENLPHVIDLATEKNWSALETIDHLFELEVEHRQQNRIALCFKQSKMFKKPTMDQFDFNHHKKKGC